MSNSSLVNVKIMTKHYGYPDGKAGRGGAKIDKIFVHHMAGILTAEQCGNVFKTRQASAHYGIDTKGRVGQYVDEANAAWHCGNKAYNQRSIGIELSNDGGAKTGWHVADKTIAKCIDLIVDICKRNGIKKINYTGDLKGNLCQHRWVASTACPASYLGGKFKYIAEQVNKKLGASPAKEVLYRVRKTWADAKSQVGAYKNLANAKKVADEKHLNVYDDKGKLVYEGKKKDELYRVRKTWADTKSQVGAYKDLNNAKKECDKHAGYSVFDESGKAVYTNKSTDTLQKWYDAMKTQYDWSKNQKYEFVKPTVTSSKTKGTCITFPAVSLQRLGMLPSGGYFYFYPDTQKIFDKPHGWVAEHSEWFSLSYPKKTIAELGDNIKKGDIVGFDNPNYHMMVYMGKNSKGTPIFNTMGHTKGLGITYSAYAKRKVAMLVRLKKLK